MKRFLSIYLRTILFCVTAGLISSSCVFDDGEENRGVDYSNSMQFIFRIGAVGSGSTRQSSDIVEMVNTLRIIIIDKNTGRLDVNERIDLATDYIAKDFSYIFIRRLTAGDKRVFLLGNEDSVGAVQLTDRAGLSVDPPLTSLKAMLDYFEAEPADEDETNPKTDFIGNTFADVLNRVYFRNNYVINGNTIALPYSAYYEITAEEIKNRNDLLNQMERSMYLVPVATKFDFHFTNYRRHKAFVDDIFLSSIHHLNYLNAQLDESELNRVKPGESTPMWWIDWLEECARGSQTATDTDKTDGYNGRWGWITKYAMPDPNDVPTELQFDPNHSVWSMNGLVDKAHPSTLILGPYYVPESYYIPEPKADDTADPADAGDSGSDANANGGQSYSLTFVVHDETESVSTTLSDNVIATLKALFRATHVIIYVEFYESKAEIYVEIKPWKENSFQGYVSQDEDYS